MGFEQGKNGKITFLDVIKSRDCKDFVSMTVTNARELELINTVSMNEYEEKTLVKTADGTFQFRDFNEGSEITLPQYEIRTCKCANANPVLDIDILLYERWEADGTLGQNIEDMKRDYFEGVMKQLGKQFYYGDVRDNSSATPDKGFPGIDKMVIPGLRFSAGGSTANQQNSLWFICSGDRYCSMVYGGGQGEPFKFGEWRRETRVENGKKMTVMACDFTMYPAVRVKRPQSIAVIKNIQSSFNDDMIGAAVAQMRSMGMEPDFALTTPRVIELLRKSRTATNPTGLPAPLPEEIANGIPLYWTSSLKENAEPVDSTTGIISVAS